MIWLTTLLGAVTCGLIAELTASGFTTGVVGVAVSLALKMRAELAFGRGVDVLTDKKLAGIQRQDRATVRKEPALIHTTLPGACSRDVIASARRSGLFKFLNILDWMASKRRRNTGRAIS